LCARAHRSGATRTKHAREPEQTAWIGAPRWRNDMETWTRSWAQIQIQAAPVIMVVIMVTGLLSLLPAGDAQAAEPGHSALCTFDVHDHTTPGYSLTTPTAGTSHGIGTLTCVGTLA